MTNQDTCKTCRYWADAETPGRDGLHRHSSCRRTHLIRWGRAGHLWCGEHKPLKAESVELSTDDQAFKDMVAKHMQEREARYGTEHKDKTGLTPDDVVWFNSYDDMMNSLT